MGMFDDIKCEMELPEKPFWVNQNTTFQSKSLDCMLRTVTIPADGQMLGDLAQWTGVIDFYDGYDTEDFRYWVEYSAVIHSGKVQTIICTQNTKEVCLSKTEEQKLDTERCAVNSQAGRSNSFEVGAIVASRRSLTDDQYETAKVVFKTPEEFVLQDERGRLVIASNRSIGRVYFTSEDEVRRYHTEKTQAAAAKGVAREKMLSEKKRRLGVE